MSSPFSRPHPVPPAGASSRLIDYLRDHLICVPVDELSALITRGEITVNGKPGAIEQRLRAGDALVLASGVAERLRAAGRWIAPFDHPLNIVFEDVDLLVVEKPSGMHVHPLGRFRDQAMTNALVFRAGGRAGNPWGEWRPHPAHRLDRPASGLVVVATNAAIRDCFGKLLEGRHVRRLYQARVEGMVREDAGTIDAPLGRDPTDDYRRAVVPEERGGQRAVTHWRVLTRSAKATLLEVWLDTGRTHQIRAHLASMGHPIEGDTLYSGGPKSPNAASIALRAVRLEFPHPRSGGWMALDCAWQECGLAVL